MNVVPNYPENNEIGKTILSMGQCLAFQATYLEPTQVIYGTTVT